MEYLGEAGVYQHVDKGEYRVKWNGTINQGQKLEAGEYTMLAYASLKENQIPYKRRKLSKFTLNKCESQEKPCMSG